MVLSPPRRSLLLSHRLPDTGDLPLQGLGLVRDIGPDLAVVIDRYTNRNLHLTG